MKKLKFSENDVEKAIVGFLRAERWRVFRLHSGTLRGVKGGWVTLNPKGTADWLAVHGKLGHILFETKAPGEQPAPEQMEFLLQADRDGLTAAWFDSFELFKAWYAEEKGQPQ